MDEKEHQHTTETVGDGRNHDDGQNTNGSSADSDATKKKKKNDYLKEELRRLEISLQREYSKVKAPEIREHFPYIFTSPYPYCNTDVANFVINKLSEEDIRGRGYKSRSTAIGLCDPETDHRMNSTPECDVVCLPVVKRSETRENTPRGNEGGKSSEKRPPKEGSTRLPKFPAVSFDARDLTPKALYYSDLPMLRDQLREKYIQNNEKKTREDYKRTRNDFYRMELDRFDLLQPRSRVLMRKCYLAYLQNTKGSKKAICECLNGKNLKRNGR